MNLNGSIIEVKQLTSYQREAMFSLFTHYFDFVSIEKFEADLREKNWVILLSDRENKIRGFSTQMLINTEVEEVKIKVIFSGDTIIEKEFRGEDILARVWLKYFTTLAASEENIRVFWFLITMGYKTYRFLPVYFKEFYPNYATGIPTFEKHVLDKVGTLKFPGEYDPQTGIIKFKTQTESLKSGIAEPNPGRLKNPHIKFFVERNPGYQRGDELACLTELRTDNYRPAVFKVINSRS